MDPAVRNRLHSWSLTPEEAVEIQLRLAPEVVQRDEIGQVRLIAGADVAWDSRGKTAIAAVAVLSFPELLPCEHATAQAPLQFPYIPGLLAFREAPPLLEAIARLRELPDLILCDGHGYAHPRRFGLACHIGLSTGIPSIGVAKTLLTGRHGDLPVERGAWAPLVDAGEKIGAAVRTRTGVKPVYVSAGHRISLETAIRYVLQCSRYRLPEPSRRADHLARITAGA